MAEPSIAAQVVALTKLSVPQLRQKWQEVFGQPTTQRHKQYLVKRIAWELQRRHFGQELSADARQQLHNLQEEFRRSPPRTWFRGVQHNRTAAPTPASPSRPVRSPQEPAPGTILTRPYKGRQVIVTVRGPRQFEYEGQMFRSLSAVAKTVTGSHLSGCAFFGLTQNRKERS